MHNIEIWADKTKCIYQMRRKKRQAYWHSLTLLWFRTLYDNWVNHTAFVLFMMLHERSTWIRHVLLNRSLFPSDVNRFWFTVYQFRFWMSITPFTMHERLLPASPNWYSSRCSDTNDKGLLAFGAKNTIYLVDVTASSSTVVGKYPIILMLAIVCSRSQSVDMYQINMANSNLSCFQVNWLATERECLASHSASMPAKAIIVPVLLMMGLLNSGTQMRRSW